MARPCEKCKRPNADRAPRCIYCGHEFANLPDRQKNDARPKTADVGQKAAGPPAHTAPRKKPEAFLVTVSPDQKTGAIERFAAIAKLDSYTAGLKLSQPAPWIVRSFHELEPAQALAKQIIDAGFDAYVVKQSGIDAIANRVQAVALSRVTREEIVFLDPGQNQIPVPFNDVALVVRGRIKQRAEREGALDEEVPRVNLGKMAPGENQNQSDLLRRGLAKLSVRPKPAMMRWVIIGHPVEIADLYLKNSPRAVRIVENEFDYSGLDSRMKQSSLLNYNAIIDGIVRMAKQAVIDRNFKLVGYTYGDSIKEDKVRTDLFTELSASETHKKIYDNQAYFNDYSARVFLHFLRENKKTQDAAKKQAEKQKTDPRPND